LKSLALGHTAEETTKNDDQLALICVYLNAVSRVLLLMRFIMFIFSTSFYLFLFIYFFVHVIC